MALDLNRGVMTKIHPTGIRVNMYLDDPGTYLDDRGEPLDPKLAEGAGFDLERDKIEKMKKIKMAQYKAMLEEEYMTAENRLASEMSKRSNFDVRPLGGNQYAAFSKGGEKIMVGKKEEIELLVGSSKIDEAS